MNEAQREMNCPSLTNHIGGRTASGTVPKPNKTLACDRELLGKKIYITGIGLRFCEDTGGAIKGNRIDIFAKSYEEALAMTKQVEFRVIE